MEACFFVHLLLEPPAFSPFTGGVLYEQNRPHLSMMCQMGGHFILYYGTCDAYHQWQMDRVAPWVPVRFRMRTLTGLLMGDCVTGPEEVAASQGPYPK